jgi:anti-anti-sigma factor
MSITFRTVVVSSRRFDLRSAVALVAVVDAEWERGVRTIALDFSPVEEVDSGGLAALVAMNKRRPFGARIVVTGLCEYVRDLFEVTQLHLAFDVYDSSAVAEFALSA